MLKTSFFFKTLIWFSCKLSLEKDEENQWTKLTYPDFVLKFYLWKIVGCCLKAMFDGFENFSWNSRTRIFLTELPCISTIKTILFLSFSYFTMETYLHKRKISRMARENAPLQWGKREKIKMQRQASSVFQMAFFSISLEISTIKYCYSSRSSDTHTLIASFSLFQSTKPKRKKKKEEKKRNDAFQNQSNIHSLDTIDRCY